MGNNQQTQYSVNVGGKTQGSSDIYRNPKCLNGLISYPQSGEKHTSEVFLNSVQKYGPKNFLGTLVSPANVYEFKTYNTVYQDSKEIGSGILNLKLSSYSHEYKNFKMNLVGVMSKNRMEWLEVDIASVLFGLTTVPLYDTLGPDTIEFILNQTSLTTIFCAGSMVSIILKQKNFHQLKNLVIFDPIPDAQISEIKSKGLNYFTWEQVLLNGRQNIQPFPKERSTQDVFTFSYTSGTTGDPKGVILTHANIVSFFGVVENTPFTFEPSDVHLSFLPLAHIYERAVVWALIKTGATIQFWGGDVNKLKEDLQRVRPTFFSGVPRLYNKFFGLIKDNFEKLEGMKKSLVQRALKAKLENLNEKAQYTHWLYDRIVFNKTKDIFGGRLRFMITASAPVSKEVVDFMKVIACVPIFEAYGQTESTGASFCTNLDDGISAHVGGCTTNIEFKTEDVPDMNYFSTDKLNGINCPRGEVCMRGPGVFAGYYKDDQKTDETIDKDSWLHTGDIGQIQPNGSLKIVDRKKNIFKLAQGEYIAPEKIENIYQRVKGCAEVFVYGDSLKEYLIAIVVPDKNFLKEAAGKLGIQGTHEELCKDQRLIDLYLANMTELGKKDNLFGFEQAKVIVLEPVSMMEHGILTSSFKLKRNEAKIYFKQTIDKLYSIPLTQQK